MENLELYLPEKGLLSKYITINRNTKIQIYNRNLPNFLSRILECCIFSSRFNGSDPLLVMGDLPLRSNCPQFVFVHTPHLIKSTRVKSKGVDKLRYFIASLVFELNIKYVKAFIVQTNVMRENLILSYPRIKEKIHIINQPVPLWLEGYKSAHSNKIELNKKIKLIYPAAGYPHKNHKLILSFSQRLIENLPIEKIVFTVEKNLIKGFDSSRYDFIKFLGELTPTQMISAYLDTNALLFLSTEESYGLPLIEAMYLGMPIICPDLPYARSLCKDGAIYFNPSDSESLGNAIIELHKKIQNGWSADWSNNLADYPENWNSVAEKFKKIILEC